MKLSELKLLVDSLHNEMTKGGINDLELVIPDGSKSFGAIGHTKVKSIHCGFDWDANLLIINPETITMITPDDLVFFLIYLNDKGLINNYDFDYEKEAKLYLKKKAKK